MRIRSLITVLLVMGLAPLALAQEHYVRDEIRINMRTGPGNQFRILKVLGSGDAVHKLAENDSWVNVRTPDGDEGWVPVGYVTPKVPASVNLPRVEAKLAQAQARVGALEATLGGQADAITELETLRARNLELEEDNDALVGSARWRSMGIGALIAFGGLLVGAMWPRGGAAGRRRIKL